MYTFHRTSKEKVQSEALLLVVSLNLISTLKKKKKKKYPTNNKRARHYFLRSALGNCTGCTSLCCMNEKVAASTGHNAPTSASVWHCQTSCPSTPGLQATSMRSVWGKVDGGGGLVFLSTSVLRANAACSSRWLHIQWPSCHQSLSQYTCRL